MESREGFTLPAPVSISSVSDALKLAEYLESRPTGVDTFVALDTETTGLHIMRDSILCWSLSDGVNRYLLNLEALWCGAFDKLFKDPDRYWAFANAKYDLHMFMNSCGVQILGPKMDIIVQAWILNENLKERGGLGLKAQSHTFLDYKMPSFRDTFNLRSESDVAIGLLNADEQVRAEYATADAHATWHLCALHMGQLKLLYFRDGYTAYDYFLEVEVPFTDVLWRMERRGIRIDLAYLKSLEQPLLDKMAKAQEALNQWAGKPVNPMSVKQLQEFLYTDLKLKPIKWTKGGSSGNQKPATDSDTLKKYADDGVEEVKHILAYREAKKMLSTYVRALIKHSVDGYIHTTFNQTGTDTGRLSSKDPNLQNIPSKGEYGKLIRKAFIADEGDSLLVLDYAQVEMRIIAHMAQDQKMIDAINAGLDLHCFTVSEAMGEDYEEVYAAKLLDDSSDIDAVIKKVHKNSPNVTLARATEVVKGLFGDEERIGFLLNQRRKAKAVGFGLLYGIREKKLSNDLGITIKEAKALRKGYFEVFPGVAVFIEEQPNRARNHPEMAVQTIIGRYRRLYKLNSDDFMTRSMDERRAVNAPIQGSSMDLCKLAMILIDKDPELGGLSLGGGSLRVTMRLQVHDELVINIPSHPKATRLIPKKVKQHMEHPGIEMDVALLTDGSIADSWAEAK